MSLAELFITAVGLSMDAFAVAVCKGLAVKKAGIKQMLLAGLWFGGFQALMPALGYLFGSTLREYVEAFDHWIAFILLGLIGFNMIKEAVSEKEEEGSSASMAIKEMFTLAVATSIDALIIGIGYAFLPKGTVNIVAAVAFIGVITLVLSAIGIKIGNVFGMKFKKKAEITGGVILILMGAKILLEHLGVMDKIAAML